LWITGQLQQLIACVADAELAGGERRCASHPDVRIIETLADGLESVWNRQLGNCSKSGGAHLSIGGGELPEKEFPSNTDLPRSSGAQQIGEDESVLGCLGHFHQTPLTGRVQPLEEKCRCKEAVCRGLFAVANDGFQGRASFVSRPATQRGEESGHRFRVP